MKVCLLLWEDEWPWLISTHVQEQRNRLGGRESAVISVICDFSSDKGDEWQVTVGEQAWSSTYGVIGLNVSSVPTSLLVIIVLYTASISPLVSHVPSCHKCLRYKLRLNTKLTKDPYLSDFISPFRILRIICVIHRLTLHLRLVSISSNRMFPSGKLVGD